MRLKVIGSSSRGNCYFIYNQSECLVLECGMPFKEVKKALNFDISTITAALVTHEHSDHSRAAKDFLKAGIPVYASAGTIEAIGEQRGFHAMEAKAVVRIGNFLILPFRTKHDSAEPFGFLIHHPETGNILFATDTYYLSATFQNLSHILIECNYAIKILNQNVSDGLISESRRKRTIQSHMELRTCRETLLANDLSKVSNIILIHLSAENSNVKQFKDEIEGAIARPVLIADVGMDINFNQKPI